MCEKNVWRQEETCNFVDKKEGERKGHSNVQTWSLARDQGHGCITGSQSKQRQIEEKKETVLTGHTEVQRKIVDISLNMSLIMIKTNRLIFLVKRQRLSP